MTDIANVAYGPELSDEDREGMALSILLTQQRQEIERLRAACAAVDNFAVRISGSTDYAIPQFALQRVEAALTGGEDGGEAVEDARKFAEFLRSYGR